MLKEKYHKKKIIKKNERLFDLLSRKVSFTSNPLNEFVMSNTMSSSSGSVKYSRKRTIHQLDESFSDDKSRMYNRATFQTIIKMMKLLTLSSFACVRKFERV